MLLCDILIILFLVSALEVIFNRPFVANMFASFYASVFGIQQIRSYTCKNRIIHVYAVDGQKWNYRLLVFLASLVPVKAKALTIGEHIFLDTSECNPSCLEQVIVHECVHVNHYRLLGTFPYLLLYHLMFVSNYLVNPDTRFNAVKAYREIPFEREAEHYANRYASIDEVCTVLLNCQEKGE